MLIKQNQKVKIDIGPEKVKMYECTGKVHSVFDFVVQYKDLLNEPEVEFINKHLSALKKQNDIPDYLKGCLCRSSDIKMGYSTFEIKRSGARSAFWVEKNIKFKGCRPLTNQSANFPMEILEFGSNKIQYGQIPFGVLSKEAVLREILGYCFFKDRRLPVVHEPLCIYEYTKDKATIGFCIIFKTQGETRIEKFIDYPEISLSELIEIKRHKRKNRFLIGSELTLKGINVNKYSDEKAKLLSEMNFFGGFRGILNSNIGNDVVVNQVDFRLALCDFDTFKIIEVPQKPDVQFLNNFVLFCIIEVLKGSVSILDFIDFDNFTDTTELNNILFEKYKKTSSLWRAYERYFWLKVDEMKWEKEFVKDAFKNVLDSEVLFKIISLVIPNSKAINEMLKNRNIYYSHD